MPMHLEHERAPSGGGGGGVRCFIWQSTDSRRPVIPSECPSRHRIDGTEIRNATRED